MFKECLTIKMCMSHDQPLITVFAELVNNWKQTGKPPDIITMKITPCCSITVFFLFLNLIHTNLGLVDKCRWNPKAVISLESRIGTKSLCVPYGIHRVIQKQLRSKPSNYFWYSFITNPMRWTTEPRTVQIHTGCTVFLDIYNAF